jgi:hypothetical protein
MAKVEISLCTVEMHVVHLLAGRFGDSRTVVVIRAVAAAHA